MKTYFDVAKTVATLCFIWAASLIAVGFFAHVAWNVMSIGWGMLG